MFLTDDHLHTRFSPDSATDPEVVCEQAIKRGLSEITLTDHLDLYTDKTYQSQLNCEEWYPCIGNLKEKYRGRLLVHRGIELGQPQINPGEAKTFLAAYPLDFIIGSIHNIDQDVDLYYCDYKSMNCQKFYAHYIDWLIDLAKNYDFDVCGHITYPSRYIFQQTGWQPDMRGYYDQFRILFRVLVERGKGIELNLSGIARGTGTTMPDERLLKFYRECGGEIITIGSDSHKPEQVGTVSKLGQEMLQAAGFKYVTWFEERKPHFEKLG